VYQDASLPWDWTARLAEHAEAIDIEFMSSPYDPEAVAHLDPYVNAVKVGSGDINWLEELEVIAATGKPVIIAAGASTLDDVKRAMDLLMATGVDIVLMQCNTNYTGSVENLRYVNLNALKQFAELYPGAVLGLSDHTPGHVTALGAVALGARVIEKHFTDDSTRVGPDHGFSLDPIAWRAMVGDTRRLEEALGDGTPPRPRVIRSRPSTRCAWSIAGASFPATAPNATRRRSARGRSVPSPSVRAGRAGRPSPTGSPDPVDARSPPGPGPFVGAHGAHAGRRPRSRILRVNVGYDPA
jgi:hypothetical protein